MICIPTARRTSVRNRLTRVVRPCSLALAAIAGLSSLIGCETTVEAPKPKPGISVPSVTNLPKFMEGTIDEFAVFVDEPSRVSGYGLVSRLHNTGDCTVSPIVRNYMWKEMVRRGFGDSLVQGYGKINPSDVFNDPRFAIVRVDAFIPPGARKDDWIDAQVSCLPNNNTSSLAHGILFETDLKDGGADVDNPSGAVNVRAVVKGPIVVNPAYALENPLTASPQAQESLKNGTVLFNTRVKQTKTMKLLLRQPQGAVVSRMQVLINNHFQDNVAKRYDDQILELTMPANYTGDYQHFVNVVRHLYLTYDPKFNTETAARLAALAVTPDAPLEDISYCWEGLGHHALNAIRPLMTNPDQRVAFYAARAAAFIGDPAQAAEQRLMQMAETKGHPYRLAAVRSLGQLKPSSSLNSLLGRLLDSELTLIRVEAYQVLSRSREPGGAPDYRIHRTFVSPANDPQDEKFILDVVPGNGPPLIYASRRGKPRIAIIGRGVMLETRSPINLADNRFTIAPDPEGRGYLRMYYRDPLRPKPVEVMSHPSLEYVIGRLGGQGTDRSTFLDFSFGEVVALLQKLSDEQRLVSGDGKAKQLATVFMQKPGRIEGDLETVVLIDASGTPLTPVEPPGGSGASQFGPPAMATSAQRPPTTRPLGGPPPSGNAPEFGPAPLRPKVESDAPQF